MRYYLMYQSGKIKFAKRVLFSILRRLLYFISIPISLVILFIKPIIRIRLIGLQSYRIGHYSLNTELMLCALDLHTDPKKTKVFFFNMSKPCNVQLYKMWSRAIPILKFRLLAIQVDTILSLIYGKTYHDKIKKTYEYCGSGAVDRTGLLNKIRKPHLSFTSSEKKYAENLMKQFGMSRDAKFICLMVRDFVYLRSEYPENDWSYHDHRDANVMDYKKVALYFAEKGYYVLRMGKYVEKEFDVTHPKIIDYANHPLRCDFMDIYFSANCVFCISTCTGLDCVSQAFRVPIVLTNISPVFSETLMWHPCTLFIPKMLKNKNTNQLLPLSEVAKTIHSATKPVLRYLDTCNLKMIENSEDELLEVAKEMEARIAGRWKESNEDVILQNQYWENHRKHAPIFVDDVYIKMGAHFLKNNPHYLE